MQTNELPPPAAFDHPKNLHVGQARLIWCESAHGWAIHGQRFICLESRAREYAAAVDKLLSGRP